MRRHPGVIRLHQQASQLRARHAASDLVRRGTTVTIETLSPLLNEIINERTALNVGGPWSTWRGSQHSEEGAMAPSEAAIAWLLQFELDDGGPFLYVLYSC